MLAFYRCYNTMIKVKTKSSAPSKINDVSYIVQHTGHNQLSVNEHQGKTDRSGLAKVNFFHSIINSSVYSGTLLIRSPLGHENVVIITWWLYQQGCKTKAITSDLQFIWSTKKWP